MLKFQQYLILALVMGLMLMQVAPAAARRRTKKTRGSNGNSNDNSNGDGNGSGNGNGGGGGGGAVVGGQTTVGINVVDLTNFLVQGFFDFLLGILAAIGLCIPLCNTAADCLNCFVLTLPPPPVLPASVIDPGNAQIIG